MTSHPSTRRSTRPTPSNSTWSSTAQPSARSHEPHSVSGPDSARPSTRLRSTAYSARKRTEDIGECRLRDQPAVKRAVERRDRMRAVLGSAPRAASASITATHAASRGSSHEWQPVQTGRHAGRSRARDGRLATHAAIACGSRPRVICTWTLSLRSTKTPMSASSERHVSLPPTRTASRRSPVRRGVDVPILVEHGSGSPVGRLR